MLRTAIREREFILPSINRMRFITLDGSAPSPIDRSPSPGDRDEPRFLSSISNTSSSRDDTPIVEMTKASVSMYTPDKANRRRIGRLSLPRTGAAEQRIWYRNNA